MACEEVVGPAGAVGRRRDGDVVDGAVDGDVDGLGLVRAVVGGELGVSEVDFALLSEMTVSSSMSFDVGGVGGRWMSCVPLMSSTLVPVSTMRRSPRSCSFRWYLGS